MATTLLIGLGAGAASALLFASAATGSVVGLLVLFMLSPLPLLIAGLGWGWGSATLAAATTALLLVAAVSGRAAVFHIVALGVPAAVACYLALLSRPVPAAGGGAALEWYPIGRIVAWAALWAGVLTAAALLATGSDPAVLKAALADTLDRMIAVGGLDFGDSRKLTDAEKTSFVEVMLVVFPWAIAASWLIMAMVNLWAAGHVTRLSGRLGRPWPDLAATALPRAMPVAFAAAIGASFLPGMTGLVASGFASAILFTYLLAGLALLHALTRGMPARPMLLSLVYFALLLMSPFSSLIVAMLGMAEPISPLRRKPPPPSAGPPPGPS